MSFYQEARVIGTPLGLETGCTGGACDTTSLGGEEKKKKLRLPTSSGTVYGAYHDLGLRESRPLNNEAYLCLGKGFSRLIREGVTTMGGTSIIFVRAKPANHPGSGSEKIEGGVSSPTSCPTSAARATEPMGFLLQTVKTTMTPGIGSADNWTLGGGGEGSYIHRLFMRSNYLS